MKILILIWCWFLGMGTGVVAAMSVAFLMLWPMALLCRPPKLGLFVSYFVNTALSAGAVWVAFRYLVPNDAWGKNLHLWVTIIFGLISFPTIGLNYIKIGRSQLLNREDL